MFNNPDQHTSEEKKLDPTNTSNQSSPQKRTISLSTDSNSSTESNNSNSDKKIKKISGAKFEKLTKLQTKGEGKCLPTEIFINNQKTPLKNLNVIVLVSVGKNNFEGNAMRAILHLASANFKSYVVVAAGTLQRYNDASKEETLLDTNNEQKYLTQASIKEQEWINRFQKNCVDYNPDVIPWENWRTHQNFDEKKQLIEKKLNEDENYQKALKNTISQYYKRQFKTSDDKSLDENSPFYQNCAQYLIEECAVTILFSEAKNNNNEYLYDQIVYPGQITPFIEMTRQLFIEPSRPDCMHWLSAKLERRKSASAQKLDPPQSLPNNVISLINENETESNNNDNDQLSAACADLLFQRLQNNLKDFRFFAREALKKLSTDNNGSRSLLPEVLKNFTSTVDQSDLSTNQKSLIKLWIQMNGFSDLINNQPQYQQHQSYDAKHTAFVSVIISSLIDTLTEKLKDLEEKTNEVIMQPVNSKLQKKDERLEALQMIADKTIKKAQATPKLSDSEKTFVTTFVRMTLAPIQSTSNTLSNNNQSFFNHNEQSSNEMQKQPQQNLFKSC